MIRRNRLNATRRRILHATQLAAGLALVGILGGCHWDMWDGARLKPYEKSDFFADGLSSRMTVPGTVPYLESRVDDHYYAGKIDGEFAKILPAQIELNGDLLKRGQDRFMVFCSPCHDAQGTGNGMVVQRGFPAPPSYHIDRLREVPIGYFYDVMTNGFGRMYSYATRIEPQDRWAIASYLRVLQLSQNATPDVLPADQLEAIKEHAHNPQEPANDEDHNTDEH
jgi:mono/diheme cytochrome c family protein